MADSKALRYPREVECGNCGRPTKVGGPPPHPAAKPLCGLCLCLSVNALPPRERGLLMKELHATKQRIEAMTLAELVAMHRDDAAVTPKTLGEAMLMAYRGFYATGRLFTYLSHAGVELPGVTPAPGETAKP